MIDIHELWKTAVGKVEIVDGLIPTYSLLFSNQSQRDFLAASQAHRKNSLGPDASDRLFRHLSYKHKHRLCKNAASDD